MTSRAGKTRPYNAPQRARAAARTRLSILRAAKARFERHGWAGTTMRTVAVAAGVSQKTVEALFGTKASLLRETVDFAIRGDVRSVPIRHRDSVAEMEAAPGATEMLDLHAAQVRRISERSAGVAWAVEHAARSDSDVAELWRRMTRNRRSGVGWAAATFLAKPDAPIELGTDETEQTFWIALDWGTYRSVTRDLGLGADEFQVWLRRYYRGMLSR
jgi:AcrR family transcriptional regulator